MVCARILISHYNWGNAYYHLFFQTPEEQQSWLYDAYYKKERSVQCLCYTRLHVHYCHNNFVYNSVYILNPLSPFSLRLIDELLTDGHLSAPRIEHPLRLHHFGLPTLFFVTVLVGALTSHYGRLGLVGSAGLFATIGMIKMAFTS